MAPQIVQLNYGNLCETQYVTVLPGQKGSVVGWEPCLVKSGHTPPIRGWEVSVPVGQLEE